jgi:hypothetical protein
MKYEFLMGAIFWCISNHILAAEITPFHGYVGIGNGASEYQSGRVFNSFMLEKQNQSVKLEIGFDTEQKIDFESSLKEPDDFKRIYFFVQSNARGSSELRGAEYLIHLPKNENEYAFKYIKEASKLLGCFDVSNINGPRQMIMSINLKPAVCQ